MTLQAPRIASRAHGRGTPENPPNRFDPIEYEVVDEDGKTVKTRYYRDTTREIVAYNDSPDVGFDAGVNPYRGCEHGCVYCYARPTHEYFGLSSGLDFESIIFVKENAPRLLRDALTSARWKPQLLGMSGVTDPYQPIEKQLMITRGCLEVLETFRNPVGLITKNYLITRDIDIIARLAAMNLAAVTISITTLDTELARRMEPRAASPERRLEAVRRLVDAGIPTGVNVAPVIPGLNDHEMPNILKSAAQLGASFAGMIMLRLPYAVKDLFIKWLELNYPERQERVLHRIQSVRQGQLSNSRFGERMRGTGVYAEQIHQMFRVACRRNSLNKKPVPLDVTLFRRPSERQLSLF